MTAEMSKKYVFGRDFAASVRYVAHRVLETGYNIHPSVPSPVQGTRVAEVAVGNAHWLIEVLQSNPPATYDAFDISLAQCPPAHWFGANVTLHEWDIFTDVPSDVVGVYDFVHVRLIGALVKDGDPRGLIGRFITMLKPGGYLQWEEYDFERMQIEKHGSNKQFPSVERLFEFMQRPQRERGSSNWWLKTPSMLKEAGFSDVSYYDTIDSYKSNLPLVKLWTDHHLTLCQEFTSYVYASDESKKAEVAAMLSDAHDEARTGAGIVLSPGVIVARK